MTSPFDNLPKKYKNTPLEGRDGTFWKVSGAQSIIFPRLSLIVAFGLCVRQVFLLLDTAKDFLRPDPVYHKSPNSTALLILKWCVADESISVY